MTLSYFHHQTKWTKLIRTLSRCINVHMLHNEEIASSGHCVTFFKGYKIKSLRRSFIKFLQEIHINIKNQKKGKNDTCREFRNEQFRTR